MRWTRPTPEQRARGIVAIYSTRYENEQGNTFWQPCPMYAHNIRRRIARGDSLPRWIVPEDKR